MKITIDVAPEEAVTFLEKFGEIFSKQVEQYYPPANPVYGPGEQPAWPNYWSNPDLWTSNHVSISDLARLGEKMFEKGGNNSDS